MDEIWKGDVQMKIGMLECSNCGNAEQTEQVQQSPMCHLCHGMAWNIVINKLEEQKLFAV